MAGGQERELRRRIRSVQSTKKITRAMELIAASRIVKAQQAIRAARPYVQKMAEVVSHLADTPDGREHPLFREPEELNKVAVISICGDRGLSGAYNSTIIRATERLIADRKEHGAETEVVAVGKKIISYLRFRDREPEHGFMGMSERPKAEDARKIADAVMEMYTEGDIGEINLIYTDFKSAGTQQLAVRKLVPLELDSPDGADDDGAAEKADDDETVNYEYEPDPSAILDRLLPAWLQAEILAALLSASASEYAARQRAMKAATDNADELIKTLSRIMNRARQDAITTEIMEIVGGAEALSGDGGRDQMVNETYRPTDARSA